MKKENNSIEVEPGVTSEIKPIRTYLKKHGITTSESEVIAASLRLSRRLGADMWSFVCELKNTKEI